MSKKPAVKAAPKQQKKVKVAEEGDEPVVEEKKKQVEEVSVHGDSFQHILRVLNSNIDGLEKVPIAFTKIKGIGRRFSNLILKRANIDLSKRYAFSFLLLSHYSILMVYRAGELSPEEIERVVAVINAPTEFQIPTWFLNRQKDFTTGQTKQNVSNALSSALRDDLIRLKKIRYRSIPFVRYSFHFLKHLILIIDILTCQF